MGQMFNDCHALTGLDVSHFNTENVTDMKSMFGYCESLTSLDVSSFNTKKVTDMEDDVEYARIDKSGLPGYMTAKNASGIQSTTVDRTGTIVNTTLYTLDGRRINGQSAQRGVYVHAGRKVAVK